MRQYFEKQEIAIFSHWKISVPEALQKQIVTRNLYAFEVCLDEYLHLYKMGFRPLCSTRMFKKRNL